jgi:hypothetical protein
MNRLGEKSRDSRQRGILFYEMSSSHTSFNESRQTRAGEGEALGMERFLKVPKNHRY